MLPQSITVRDEEATQERFLEPGVALPAQCSTCALLSPVPSGLWHSGVATTSEPTVILETSLFLPILSAFPLVRPVKQTNYFSPSVTCLQIDLCVLWFRR